MPRRGQALGDRTLGSRRLMDRAGWHSTDKLKVPKNLTIILLPSRSPEGNVPLDVEKLR